MKIFLYIATFLFFTSISYAQPPRQSLPDSVYNEMIWFAKGEVLINDTIHKFDSNTSYYVVATVTNSLTNETKELCTSFDNLQYAVKVDSNTCQKQCNRQFSFSSMKSLEIIGFDDYEYKKFNTCTKEVNSDSLYLKALNYPVEFANEYSGECQKYIAHLLFNNGIMSSASSLSGHLFILGKTDKKVLVKEMMKTNH